MEGPDLIPDVKTEDPRPGVDEDDMIRNVVRLVFSGNKDGALHVAKALESEDVFDTAIVFAEAGFADQFKDMQREEDAKRSEGIEVALRCLHSKRRLKFRLRVAHPSTTCTGSTTSDTLHR